jgi:hypothetical protein
MSLSVTFETQGQGRLTEKEIEELVVRNKAGRVVQLKMPKRSVVISNHQVAT